MLKRHWFLFGLMVTFIVVVFDTSGQVARIGMLLKNCHGASLTVFSIFLLSGLLIEAGQIRSGVMDMQATLAALFTIIIASPVVAVVFYILPLDTGILIGLFLVAAMPTTLSSGVVMTGRAGGNMAHALYVTILSNSGAVISIPIVLSLLLMVLDEGRVLSIDQPAIMIKLLVLVLLPLAAGILLKKYLIRIDQKEKKAIQIINQLFIICIVFMSISGTRGVLLSRPEAFIIITPLVIIFHACLLAISFLCCRCLKIRKGRMESVIFMGSQKTLPLSVMIQMTCFEAYGTALLVCVLHHIFHLIIDGYLCVRMRNAGGTEKV